MRSRILTLLLASTLLTGCFPRHAHYEGDPAAPAMPQPRFDGPTADVPQDRLEAFIRVNNPFLSKELVQREAAAIIRCATAEGIPTTVRLKVYEWRASRDVIFEWTALNDDFTVSADGTLFVPFVGQIRAQGTAPGDLARAIGDRLMQQMGLSRPPDVAVEIAQYRPFYIVGNVAQPGEFPFRPGLTVLQAMGIAGGLRTRDEDLPRLEREMITGQGDINLLSQSSLSLLARKARLESEQAGNDDISFPPDLTQRASNPLVAVAMEHRIRRSAW